MLLRKLILFGVVCVTSCALAAPTVTVTAPTPDATVSSLTSISVTFNEAVAGVDATDLLINNEAAASVSGSGTGPYVFTFTQPAPGTVSVSWEFDHGIAGLGTGAFAPVSGWEYTLTDTLPPTIAKIRTSQPSDGLLDAIVPLPSSRVGALTQVEVNFNEDVTGVTGADLLINGAPATSVSGEGAGPYVFTFAQPALGTVNFSWAAGHGIVDSASNAFAGGAWSVTRASSPGNVVINEFLAANATGLADENGDRSDWIELRNLDASVLNLAGWTLTDDPDRPGKWVLPSRTINAGGFLVIFASGKDRKPAAGNLHTNFSLGANGGYLALHPPSYPLTATSRFPADYDPEADPPVEEYPPQRYNYSYGPLTSGPLRYFATPTPGATNGNSSTLVNVSPAPNASVTRGFFKDPFSVILTCTSPTATVRYTLDGSEPLVSSPAYSTPIQVTNTTLLRAAAFSATTVPSDTVTHSYIFLDSVFAQTSPPYDNPANAGDNSNPQPPSVGGVPLPVVLGTRTIGSNPFPGQITNLNANEVPADYGMDAKIWNDPVKYDDLGNINDVTGRTNLDRMQESLRTLPILSVVFKTSEIFGPTGSYAATNAGSKPDLTKACSLEFLLPDGSTGFVVPAGIDIHGNASRSPENCGKRAFTLRFKGAFGAGRLEYQLFPESPAKEINKLVLRGDFNSSWNHHDNGNQRPKGTRIRDAFCKDTFRDMGRPAGHNRYVNLFLNGIYWGTYDLAEEEDDGFGAAYYGGKRSDYDVYEQGILKEGTNTAYLAMTGIAAPIDNPKYEQMKTYLDVPQFIDYMLLHFFVGHEDWGGDINKNWYAIRNRAANGTFKYLPWDMENLLWSEGSNRVGVTSPPSGLHTKLLVNQQYRLDFADRVHAHLVSPDGALLPAANIARLNKWTSIMNAGAMALESARWGDYRRDVHRFSSNSNTVYTWNGKWFESGATQTGTAHWRAEINRLTGTYFLVRTNNVLSQLRTAAQPLYPAVNAPEIRNNATNLPIASQRVNAGFVIKFANVNVPPGGTSNAATFYYTTNGVDPRVYYAGTIDPAATPVAPNATLAINATTTVKVRAFNGATWSALNEQTFRVEGLIPRIRFTELHYNPPGGQGGSSAEFFEIQNTGTSAVDLSNWYFTGIDLIIGAGTVLGPGGRLVFASNDDPATFAAQFPSVSVAAFYGGALNNSGERIALYNAGGGLVTSVEYSHQLPWPVLTGGRTIEVIDPDGDPNLPANWKLSSAAKGTPGAANGSPAASPVIVSEFLARNAGAYSIGGQTPGYVELLNTSGASVDLGNATLWVNGVSHSLPLGTTIGAGQYLVVHFSPASVPAVHFLGALPGQAGVIHLRNNSGTVFDGVRYGPQAANLSFGRIGGVWTLGSPTPAAANAATATAAQATVRLNEWLANPLPGDDDWLELVNSDGALPVSLTGMVVSTSADLFRLDAPSAIAPGDYVRLFANRGNPAPNVLDFNLPSDGATLSLFDSNGAPADSQAYPAQVEGVSRGRLPNATGALIALPYPSPGVANHAAIVGPQLNEVLAFNLNDENAPWARRAPWVELHNPTGGSVSLAGWQLRCPPQSTSFTIPNGVSIPAGGYLSIWLDVKQLTSTVAGPHLNFAFGVAENSPVLDTLELVNSGGQVVDRIAFGKQLPDLSIGRLNDQSWALLTAPTRNGPNSGAAPLGPQTALRLNEWFADLPGQGAGDYVELYNTSALPVSLAGLYLSDDPSEVGRRKYQVPPLSFIAGYGFATFDTRNTLRNSFNTGFELAGTGEYLRLGLADDTELDGISFGLQTGLSQGRQPEGSTTVATFAKTRGLANVQGTGPWFTSVSSSLVVPAGQPVPLSVTAINTASFQWRRNGQPIDGATGQLYEIPAATGAHDGVYDCVATGVGTAISPPITLTVLHTYTTWAAEKGLTGIYLPPTADADDDGITNLAEFVANSNPLATETPGNLLANHLVAALEPGFLTIDFRLNRRAAIQALFTELNTTLPGSWALTAPSEVALISTEPNGDEHWRYKFAVPPTGSRLLRMGITE